MTDRVATEVLPSAPTERGVFESGGGLYEISGSLEMTDGTKDLSGSTNFESALSDVLHKLGRVDLVSLVLKYRFTSTKQIFKCAVTSYNSSSSIADCQWQPGAVSVGSNEANVGVMNLHDVQIPDCYSRQVQPVSSDLPKWRCMFFATSGVMVGYTIVYKHYGKLRENFNIKFA